MSIPSKLLAEDRTEELLEYAGRLAQLHQGKTFHSKQQSVFKAIIEKGYKKVFCRKGRKGGGTETALYVALRIAAQRNKIIYLIYPTAVLGREIIWDNNRIKSFMPPEWRAQYRENKMQVILPWGSTIKILGADNHKSMVGIEGDAFIFDELKDHDPRAYKNCYPNIASRDALWMVLGAAPKNKSNFYYKTEQDALKNPTDWFCIHWSTWENAEFLPGGRTWIQKEKDSYYARGDWDEWEVEWEARYVLGGKNTVIPAFDSTKHVVPHEDIDARIYRDKGKLRWFQIFDPGYATCFAVLFVCINDYTGEIFFLDEIYETDRKHLSVNEIWPRVKEIEDRLYKGGRWRRIYDSAATGFANEVRSRWGRDIKFIPTHKSKDDEDKYFRILNSIFFQEKALVSENCPKLVWEIENYLTSEDGTYPDRFNHQLDNSRYFLKMSNYKLQEKQDDVILVPEQPALKTLDDAFSDRRRKTDWADSLIHDDGAGLLFKDDDYGW